MRLNLITVVALGVLAAAAVARPPARQAERNVEVVVDSSLYASGEITASIEQYMMDIRAQGYLPTLTTTDFADAAAVRGHLADRYNTDGLAGAVFVGDVPTATYHIPDHAGWEYGAETFPIDLFFQDLDGTWADENSDGKYDSHTGDVQAEIWMGRLKTSTLTSLHPGRTEAGMINDYFAKNHAYRQGQLAVPSTGLAFIDDDWEASGPDRAFQIGRTVSGEVRIVNNDPSPSTASAYRAELSQGYEHVFLAAHSNPTIHQFGSGTVYNTELAGLDPQSLFYTVFGCKTGKYTASGYMGGEYIFGEGNGLVFMGMTKIGGFGFMEEYFDELSEGGTFGSALQRWWDVGSLSPDWTYGGTMFGDPLLTPQMYQPYLVWGDFDGDGDADGDDIELLRQNINSGDQRYDVDGDGYVSMSDLTMMIAELVEWSGQAGQGVGTAMGDFNLDGLVDTTDLTILGTYFGTQGTWAEGNANRYLDLTINTTDLTILSTYFGFDASVDSIPEPVTMSLLAMGGLAVLRRRSQIRRGGRK